jgi:PEP-CTERM motif-containing protein
MRSRLLLTQSVGAGAPATVIRMPIRWALSLLSDVDLLILQAPNSGFRLATLNFLGKADGFADFQFAFGPGNDVKCDNNQVCIPSVVPEPGTISLLALGGMAWLHARRRRSKPEACGALPPRS